MPGKELQPRREPEPTPPYVRTARFASDTPALQAYASAQEIIFKADCDLSAYRIRFEDVPHVVVIGSSPTPDVDTRLSQTLASGELSHLPADILQVLSDRRAQAQRLGPWVEGHYRPGKPM